MYHHIDLCIVNQCLSCDKTIKDSSIREHAISSVAYDSICERDTKSGTKGHPQVSADIYKSLENLCGKGNLDLEAIVTVIVDLKEKEHINENIGDLALFLSGGKKGLQILQRYWDIEERYLYV